MSQNFSHYKPYEGLFITIEGGDGSGKSTVALHLLKELQHFGYHVMATREPGGTALSEHIRNLLLHTPEMMKIGDRAELMLFLAARLQHIEEKILPHLHAKGVVICERFNDSTIAYQGCARLLGMEFVEKLCQYACAHLTPDITIFLDIDPEEGLRRILKKTEKSFDRLEKENLQFHKNVRQGFLHLADKYDQRISIVDAHQPLEDVLKDCLKVIQPYLSLKVLPDLYD